MASITATESTSRLRLWAWLFGAGVTAYAAAIPYLASTTKTIVERVAHLTPEPPPPMAVLVGAQFLQTSLLLALFIWLGAVFAPKAGLDAPLIRARLSRTTSPIAWRPLLKTALLTGTLVAFVLLAIRLVFADGLRDNLGAVKAPPAVLGLFSALFGGVIEELLVRWGWMAPALVLLRQLRLSESAAFWGANLLSALVFGALHLPFAYALTGVLTPPMVAYVLIGNGVAGLLFGVMFKRQGLEAAMIAHATTDVWLHFVFALV